MGLTEQTWAGRAQGHLYRVSQVTASKVPYAEGIVLRPYCPWVWIKWTLNNCRLFCNSGLNYRTRISKPCFLKVLKITHSLVPMAPPPSLQSNLLLLVWLVLPPSRFQETAQQEEYYLGFRSHIHWPLLVMKILISLPTYWLQQGSGASFVRGRISRTPEMKTLQAALKTSAKALSDNMFSILTCFLPLWMISSPWRQHAATLLLGHIGLNWLQLNPWILINELATQPGVVAHACNSRIPKAEAEGYRIQGHL